MSFWTLVKQAVNPPQPASNMVRVFIGATGFLQSINEAGEVTEYASAGSIGEPNGVCPLGGDAKVPAAYLPSYVDDVLEYANLAAFPATGETGKIYVALDTNKTYRWSGTVYVEISANQVTSVFGRVGAVVATSGDYNASQVTFTPTGDLSSTHVQAALIELDTEKAKVTRSITSGAGLIGGGDLSADRTISMPNVGTAGTYGSASQVPVVSTDAQGRVTGVVNTLIAIVASQVADFVNAVRSALSVANTPSITLSYTGGQFSGVVVPGGVDHDALQNFVATEHVDHSAVSITAGAGLTGGGDITTSRTISMPNVGTAGTFGDASTYPVITTDAQGRVTSATALPLHGGLIKAKTTAAVANSSNVTNVNLTELGITLAANTSYEINVTLVFRSANTNTGISLAYGAGTAVIASVTGFNETSLNTTTVGRLTFVSATTNTVFASSAATNQDQIMNAKLILNVGATGGTFVPQFRSETNGTAITVQPGSRITAEAF